MTGRSPGPARRQSPGVETSKAASTQADAKRRRGRNDEHLPGCQTDRRCGPTRTRPDANAPSRPPGPSTPARLTFPRLPKIHSRPLSPSLVSLCDTTSVKTTTPPSLLQNTIIHPDAPFTTPSAFPLFVDFPPTVRWFPVRVFRKHPAHELTSIKTSPTPLLERPAPKNATPPPPAPPPARPISGDPHNVLAAPLSWPLTTTHWSVSHRSPVLRGVSAGV